MKHVNFGAFYNSLAETNLKKFGYKMKLHVFYLLFVFLMISISGDLFTYNFVCFLMPDFDLSRKTIYNFNNAPLRNLTIVISFRLKY